MFLTYFPIFPIPRYFDMWPFYGSSGGSFNMSAIEYVRKHNRRAKIQRRMR